MFISSLAWSLSRSRPTPRHSLSTDLASSSSTIRPLSLDSISGHDASQHINYQTFSLYPICSSFSAQTSRNLEPSRLSTTRKKSTRLMTLIADLYMKTSKQLGTPSYKMQKSQNRWSISLREKTHLFPNVHPILNRLVLDEDLHSSLEIN